jgi:S-DNA-T family DNA segregation ATPase FtsK/SpoIIIE
MFRYRVQLAPFLLSLWVFGTATVIGPVRFGTVGMALVCAIAAAAMFRYGHMYRLAREVERRYAAACASAVGLWIVYGTWGGTKPGPRAIVVLLLGTCIAAAPWWHHRRIRAGIKVVFQDLPRAKRQARTNEARRTINDWDVFIRAAKLEGSKLTCITFDKWSVTLRVKLRRGGTVGEFTSRRMEQLESAFGGVNHGSGRVERVRTAGWVDIRFMLTDPLAKLGAPPPPDGTNLITIGRFETGQDVVLDIEQHFLVAGKTGAGKSNLVQGIIAALVQTPWVAVVLVDLSPGAPEFSRWEGKVHAVATTPKETAYVLAVLTAGMERRGQHMKARGWQKWEATPAEPHIVCIVDEAQGVKKAKLDDPLADLAALLRKYGGTLGLATQYPTDKNLPTTVKQQMRQVIGLRTFDPVAARVIFGDNADADGWRTWKLTDHRFYIQNETEYTAPLQAKAHFLDKARLARIVDTAPAPVRVDTTTWSSAPDAPAQTARPDFAPAGALPAGVLDMNQGPDLDIVDAVVVDDDPDERILSAIGRGVDMVMGIVEETGMSKPTVHRRLRKLEAVGLVRRTEKRGGWERC